jgi:hypothetical protein
VGCGRRAVSDPLMVDNLWTVEQAIVMVEIETSSSSSSKSSQPLYLELFSTFLSTSILVETREQIILVAQEFMISSSMNPKDISAREMEGKMTMDGLGQ